MEDEHQRDCSTAALGISAFYLSRRGCSKVVSSCLAFFCNCRGWECACIQFSLPEHLLVSHLKSPAAQCSQLLLQQQTSVGLKLFPRDLAAEHRAFCSRASMSESQTCCAEGASCMEQAHHQLWMSLATASSIQASKTSVGGDPPTS